jgi:hypothetical protein
VLTTRDANLAALRDRVKREVRGDFTILRAGTSPTDVPEVLAHVESRVMKLLKRRGLLDPSADGHPVPDEFARRNPAMAAILQASLLDVSVLDADHQLPTMRERGAPPDDVRRSQSGKNEADRALDGGCGRGKIGG